MACIIINNETLEVVTVSGKDQKDLALQHLPDTEKAKCVFLECPSGRVPFAAKGVRNPDGSVGLEFDVEKERKFRINSLRPQRDRLLQESDWTQARDSPLTIEQQDAWAAYRKELRDLPSNTADPTQVVWPTPPS